AGSHYHTPHTSPLRSHTERLQKGDLGRNIHIMIFTNDNTGRHLVLATDGACLGNPGMGGWAVIIHEYAGDTVVSRSAVAGHADDDTTNNQMELQAAIEAVRYAKTLDLPAVIITDSQYVQR